MQSARVGSVVKAVRRHSQSRVCGQKAPRLCRSGVGLAAGRMQGETRRCGMGYGRADPGMWL